MAVWWSSREKLALRYCLTTYDTIIHYLFAVFERLQCESVFKACLGCSFHLLARCSSGFRASPAHIPPISVYGNCAPSTLAWWCVLFKQQVASKIPDNIQQHLQLPRTSSAHSIHRFSGSSECEYFLLSHAAWDNEKLLTSPDLCFSLLSSKSFVPPEWSRERTGKRPQ